MIARACYVMCDECASPAPVSVNGYVEARRLARFDMFVRTKDGRDLCRDCAPKEDAHGA